MIERYLSRLLFVLILTISSCSIEVDQPSVETPFPGPDAIVTNSGTSGDADKIQMPVTWASLNLTGKLIYNIGAIENNTYIVRVLSLDLVTGQVDTIYKAPTDAWVYYVSVSPDHQQLLMSFSPPPGADPNIVQALYAMPLDASKPAELLFMPGIREDQYFQVEWSPDGKYIYYTHVNYQIPEDPNRIYPLYEILRISHPGGQSESIVQEAYWPRLSPDSSRLVYISVDPLSTEQKLMLADADGSKAQEVDLSGPYIPDIKDAPIFSPDGESIIFSAAVPIQSQQPNWFEKLTGMHIAKANGGVPSDWWSVPVNGGVPTRLTHLQAANLYASLSPDNNRIVSYSSVGIFVMNPDGSELTVLVPNPDGFTGTVHWIP